MSGGLFKFSIYLYHMIGIYKITSPTGKIYIGSSNDIENRFCKYKRLKCKTQTKLYNSFIKHGVENHVFEIIEICSINVLLGRELYYGKLFNVLDKHKGLNCRLPKAGEIGKFMSDETKQKIGKANSIIQKGKKVKYYPSKLKKLSIEQVFTIKMLLVENELTQKEIGEMFHVGRKIISNISTGKNYSSLHVGIDVSKRKKKYIKLTIDDYDIIKTLIKSGMKQSEVAKKYNIDQSYVSRIINNNIHKKK